MSTNPIDTSGLLDDLKRLVKDLKADLLERAGEVAEVGAGLRAAHRAVAEGGRTAQAFEAWRDDYLEQVAVAWVLACVFIRYLEDNELIAETYLAGVGDRRRQAEDALEAFHRAHPHDTDRDYLLDVFTRVRSIRAAADLYAEGKTPIWAVGPSGDGAKHLLRFWQEIDPETGGLARSFRAESGDTRFLGDLYQDLSDAARKKYALLQTPDFVEEFILDHTLTPALDEFGLEAVRLIDPTCGSGHFLLGAFRRLFDLWARHEPGTEPAVLAGRVLEEQVFGVDVNPFAVAIARFRLIVEAMHACGIGHLKDAPGWHVNVVFGDSLMHGDKFDRRGFSQEWLPSGEPWADPIYAIEDPAGLKRVLGRQYHVVVGNPPYITVKDAKISERYRRRWETCHGKYSMGAPFTERFFNLALAQDGTRPAGYVGMITANSFMKREFGKKLIEEFLPEYDLTHVIDTSGAYIPGHGTPTVILFGQNRRPVGDEVRAVLGIRGEPTTPDDPAQGLVWRSIMDYLANGHAQNDFVSVADVSRATFGNHPWSIGGGGAAELKEQIDNQAASCLNDIVEPIGFASFPGLDDAFVMDEPSLKRKSIPPCWRKQFLYGETIRDWVVTPDLFALAPYDERYELVDLAPDSHWGRHLWTVRSCLEQVVSFGGKTRKQLGDRWWGWYRWIPEKYRTHLSITFPFVASHNHFVLDRGGKVFNRSAPVIKLPADATEDEHLALLGLLNSSTACFWLKQVSQQKQLVGGDGVRVEAVSKVPYEFAGTQMERLPIPDIFLEGPLRERLLRLAKLADEAGRKISQLTAQSAIESGLSVPIMTIQDRWKELQAERRRCRSRLVILQEEIDFTCYVIYKLTDETVMSDCWEWPETSVDAGQRPFEILTGKNQEGFPVSDEIPTGWPKDLQELWQRRIDAIAASPELRLIEHPHYKRRWIGRQGLFNHTKNTDELADVCWTWMLDRLESGRYWPTSAQAPPELVSCAALANIAAQDVEFQQVAALYAGRPDFDLTRLVEDLVASESVPFLPVLRYKSTGQTKRQVWERTWNLQRREDDREDVGTIPVPPKYTSADFLTGDIWRLRGKLDVSKERFVSYPHCGRDGDPSLVVGWAGWDHLRQAQALAAYYERMKTREGWPPERLVPLLAGLDQLVFWLKLWHNEVDPEYDLRMGDYYEDFVRDEAQGLGYTLDRVRAWQPPAKARGGRGRKKT